MIVKALALGLAAIILFPVVKVVWRLSFDPRHQKHHPGQCRRLEINGVGSEDIQVLSSGLVFISSGVSFPTGSPQLQAYSKTNGGGRIQVFDMKSSATKVIDLKIKHGNDFNPITFRPHGLSVLEDKVKGEHIVYVINHADDGEDRVEKFQFSPKTKELRHVRSFFDDLFRVTNDLAVLTEDKFYISNFYFSKSHILGAIEQIYKIPACNILFYNGTAATKVVDRLVSPNGVTLSKDKRFIYVSFPDAEVVRVYERNSDTEVNQVQEVYIHTSLDNFHLSLDGNSLLGGCHPNARKIILHMTDPVNRSPSQILRLPLKEGLIMVDDVIEEFYDHGDLITASTVAGVYQNKMIIGSVIDSLVICQLTTQCPST